MYIAIYMYMYIHDVYTGHFLHRRGPLILPPLAHSGRQFGGAGVRGARPCLAQRRKRWPRVPGHLTVS